MALMAEDVMRVAIGDTIRAERSARHLSQQQLARLVGASRSSIGLWESGDRTPDLLQAGRLAAALGLPFAGLVGEVERRAADALAARRLHTDAPEETET